MASTSKHPLDIYRWIEKIIKSSDTQIQLMVADKLIYNFDKYATGKISDDLLHDLCKNLRICSLVRSSTIANDDSNKKVSQLL